MGYTEYVVVIYPTDLKVHIDGNPAGLTNNILFVERGHHSFKLENEKGKFSESIERVVDDTTSVSPMIIYNFQLQKWW